MNMTDKEKIKEIVKWHDHCCYKRGKPCVARDGLEDEITDLLNSQKQDIIKLIEKMKKPEFTEITESIAEYNREHGYPEDYQEPIKENQGYNQALTDILKEIK